MDLIGWNSVRFTFVLILELFSCCLKLYNILIDITIEIRKLSNTDNYVNPESSFFLYFYVKNWCCTGVSYFFVSYRAVSYKKTCIVIFTS